MAYEPPAWAYKPAEPKLTRTLVNDILHTRISVAFNWQKKHVIAEAKITAKPYFYPQKMLVLDAKGFEIKSVYNYQRQPLSFNYDGQKLSVELGKTYTKNDTFSVYINYVAKPEELKTNSGSAIASDKGLFFITPDSVNPTKPYQIWTQGEPESNSCWFPTIDSPNEKMTHEIYITVADTMVTLSNGILVKSTKNNDGTRTDYWKMSQPHSVYLTMLAVGKFAVIKDKWRNIMVDYYVEPAYAPYAKQIFGKTPVMMEFFSQKLNYPYPWPKYSSIVVRDYVSGAMENTSATVFMDALQKTDRELIDENYENIIAHELFHHWFGNLVTCESWSHLPLNESFATYGEYLWEEHERGSYAAEYARKNELESYLNEATRKRAPMIRFGYQNPDDMFDSHSYAKGACLLHSLRKTIGDEAFFESLNHYLTTNAYQTTEIHHLRHSFEKVTGQDLTPFFYQWFERAGHPELVANTDFSNGKLTVKIWQVQDTLYAPLYTLNLPIHIWLNGERKVYPTTVNKSKHTFEVALEQKPDVVIIDPEHTYVYELNHQKTLKEWISQYSYAPEFFAKYIALENISERVDSALARQTLLAALKENFWAHRLQAVEALAAYKGNDTLQIVEYFTEMAKTEKHPEIKAAIIKYLGRKSRLSLLDLYKSGMKDSSYAVAGASLSAYLKLNDPDKSITLQQFDNETNPEIVNALTDYYLVNYDSTKIDWFVHKLYTMKPESLFYLIQDFGTFLLKSGPRIQEKGIALLMPLAQNSPFEWIRFAAFKSLSILEQKELKNKLIAIKNQEKSERLRKLYDSFL